MAIDQDLLQVLRCPETHQKVSVADDSVVESLNQQIAAGTLVNRGGAKVDEPIDAALVREDGLFLYVIRDEIPEMLIDSAIPLAG